MMIVIIFVLTSVKRCGSGSKSNKCTENASLMRNLSPEWWGVHVAMWNLGTCRWLCPPCGVDVADTLILVGDSDPDHGPKERKDRFKDNRKPNINMVLIFMVLDIGSKNQCREQWRWEPCCLAGPKESFHIVTQIAATAARAANTCTTWFPVDEGTTPKGTSTNMWIFPPQLAPGPMSCICSWTERGKAVKQLLTRFGIQ